MTSSLTLMLSTGVTGQPTIDSLQRALREAQEQQHTPSTLSSTQPQILAVVTDAGGTRRQSSSKTRRQSKVVKIEPSTTQSSATKMRLSSVEAQRMMSVMEDTIRRADLAARLPHVTRDLCNVRLCLGSDLNQLLERHSVILDSLRELEQAASSDRGGGVDEGGLTSKISLTSRVASIQAGDTMTQYEKRETRVPDRRVSQQDSLRTTSEEPKNRPATPRSYCSDVNKENGAGGRSESGGDEGSENRVGETSQTSPVEEDMMSSGLSNKQLLSTIDDRNNDMQNTKRNKTFEEAAKHNLMLVAREMQNSCRNIIRAFVNNPSAASEFVRRKDCEDSLSSLTISSEAERLIEELIELKNFMRSMFLTTPVEELERSQYIRELRDKERYNRDTNEKLSAELRAAEEELDNEVKQQNEVIRRLQAELHKIEKNSDDQIDRTRLERDKQEAAERRTSEMKQTKLQAELDAVKGQYNSLLTEHRSKELALRKRKFQVESEVENWIQKFDGDMGERQDEYDRIDSVYSEEKRQLNMLEEKFKALEAEYQLIVEARRTARETREAAERELQMCIRAAMTIQAFWRSFKVRRTIKMKKKKTKSTNKKSVKW